MNRLIVAIDSQRGLAKNGKMPWKIPEDEQYFTDQTKTFGGNVLVGRATFETFKGPLVDRHNYVLTRREEPIEGVVLVHDLPKFIKDFKNQDVWVVGGAKVFEQYIDAGWADELYLTHINANLDCDQFFPAYQDQFTLAEQSPSHKQNGFTFSFAKYIKTPIQ